MRWDSSEVKAKGGRARSPIGSRRGPARKSVLRRLALEDLEPRTLLAAQPLPAPGVDPAATLVNISGRGDLGTPQANQFSPSIAVDPNNPLKLAAVWTQHETNSNNFR